MNALAISINTPVTMTSLELVDYINSQREPDDNAVLRHRDFVGKVPKVLGEEMGEKFRTSFKDTYGRDQPGYCFPKREACLMAMSYSYELQAKVYDYMTALETQLTKASLPDFTNPVAAARAWADQFEKSSQVVITNQHLVQELSEVKQKHITFKDVRGCGETFATINEITKATGIRYGFWALKKWCDEQGAPRKEVHLTMETFTYAYPDKAWADVHGLELAKIFGE